MKRNKTKLWISLFFALASLSDFSSAQVRDDRTQGYTAAVYTELRRLDNANRADEDTGNEIEENQYELGANLNAWLERQYVQFQLDYDLARLKFQKNTQDDQSVWTGASSLNFGNENSLAELNLGHSIRRVLVNPTGPRVVDNSNERQIFSALPLVRLRFDGANSLLIRGLAVKVEFDDNAGNSERIGGGFDFLHKVSPVTQLTFVVRSQDIDFTESDTADYHSNQASVVWNTALSALSYQLEVGVLTIEPEQGNDQEEGLARLAVNYDTPGNLFSLVASQEISDSSFGNGNETFFLVNIGIDGSAANPDQLRRRSANLLWANSLLCQRCELGAQLGYEEEDYFNLVINDVEERSLALSLDYALTRSLEVRTSYRYLNTDFASDALSDFVEYIMRVGLSHAYGRHLETEAYLENDRRDTDVGDDYTVNTAAIRLTWNF